MDARLGQGRCQNDLHFANSSTHLDVSLGSLMCLSYEEGKGNARSPRLTTLSGGPHHISEHEKPLTKEKQQLELERLRLLRLSLYTEGTLVVFQLKPNGRVPFRASGIDRYFNLCLGLCSNRKFYYPSPLLFKTTLIRKLYLH